MIENIIAWLFEPKTITIPRCVWWLMVGLSITALFNGLVYWLVKIVL